MVFQEQTYAVLLVSGSEKFSRALVGLLPQTDFWPVTAVRSSGEARRALLGQSFDLVLINAPLTDESGLHLASDLCAGGDAGVLLFVKSEQYEQLCARATPAGVMLLAKPASAQTVLQTLRMLCAVRERLRGMERRQASVEEKIEEIRLVNRAKWALIRCLSLSEEEAHHYIERQAMDTRRSKRAVAENILKTYPEQDLPSG